MVSEDVVDTKQRSGKARRMEGVYFILIKEATFRPFI